MLPDKVKDTEEIHREGGLVTWYDITGMSFLLTREEAKHAPFGKYYVAWKLDEDGYWRPD